MPLGFVPPPDFRYISLEPRLAQADLKAKALRTGALVCGAGVVAGSMDALTALWASALGVGAALFMLHRGAVEETAARVDVEHIAIVPWGVLVHSRTEPRVLRWGAIESIQVRYVHTMDEATPIVRWSVVTLRARRETLEGRAHGLVALERLEAHLASYAREAGRAIALDETAANAAVSDFEPVFSRLLDQVHHWIRTPETIPELELDARGYRGGSQGELGDEGLRVLRTWLTENALEREADRRPLAAVLAAELRARALVEPLLLLVTSPHPFVAAVARAAALRLGADVRHVGAIQELSDFLAEPELEAILRWGARA